MTTPSWHERAYAAMKRFNDKVEAGTAHSKHTYSEFKELLAQPVVLDATSVVPIPMLLHCPACGLQHIDAPDNVHDHFDVPMDPHSEDGKDVIARMREFERTAWTNPPHRSHLCAACGCIWRPSDLHTTGVKKIETRGQKDNFF